MKERKGDRRDGEGDEGSEREKERGGLKERSEGEKGSREGWYKCNARS